MNAEGNDGFALESRWANNIASGQSRVHYGHSITINNNNNVPTNASQLKLDLSKECLASLRPLARNPRLQTVETAHEESFHWIWDEGSKGPGFMEWMREGHGFYWISGKPGAGKSTLMKYIYNNFLEKATSLPQEEDSSSLRIGYFFHEVGIPQERTFLGFLTAILHQLLLDCEELSSSILPIFNREKNRAGEEEAFFWTEDILKEALWAISKQKETRGTVYLFIDGLDECESDTVRRDELDDFLVPWVEQARTSSLSVKVCLASRRNQEIELHLSHWPGIRIHDRTAADIYKYVKSKLHQTTERLAKKHRNQQYLHTVRDRLVQTLVTKAEGVFLWVKLVLKETIIGLESGNSDAELQAHIDSLPIGIKDLYAKIIGNIDSHYLIGTWIYTQMLCRHNPIHEITVLDVSFAEEDLASTSQFQSDTYLSEHPLVERCSRTKDRIQSRCGVLLDFRPTLRNIGLSPYDYLQTLLSSSPENEWTGKDEERTQSSHILGNENDNDNARLIFVHRSVYEYLEEPRTKKSLLERMEASATEQLDVNVALMKGCLGRLIATRRFWPPWNNCIPGDVLGLLNCFFGYVGTLDECTSYPVHLYVSLLDRIYREACDQWHLDYYRACASRLVPQCFHYSDDLTLGEQRSLVFCAIDGTQFGTFPSELLAALLEHHTHDKKVLSEFWRALCLAFRDITTGPLWKWHDYFEIFLKNGVDPNATFWGAITNYSSEYIDCRYNFTEIVETTERCRVAQNAFPQGEYISVLSETFGENEDEEDLNANDHASPHPNYVKETLSKPTRFSNPQQIPDNPFGRRETCNPTKEEFTRAIHIICGRCVASCQGKSVDIKIMRDYQRIIQLFLKYGAISCLPNSKWEYVTFEVESILNLDDPTGRLYRQTPDQVRASLSRQPAKDPRRTWAVHEISAVGVLGSFNHEYLGSHRHMGTSPQHTEGLDDPSWMQELD